MNHLKKIFILPVILFLVITSCKNDLKLNAPYKEFPSIYAVLTPQDNIHVIRINKVFLGEGDANKMAQVSDSVNYPAGELTVTLERFVNGAKTQATPTGTNPNMITFTESVVTTDPGAFSTTQRIYITYDKLYTDGDYVLKVTNNKTGNVFTAKSPSLDSIKPNSPAVPFTTDPYYGNPGNVNQQENKTIFIDYGNPSTNYSLRFLPNNGTIYQVTMRLHYFDSLNSGPFSELKQYEYVDFPFTRQNKKDALPIGNQGPFITNFFKTNDLLSTVATSLEKKSRAITSIEGRKLYKIDFIVYSSSQDYLDYLEFSAPSLSIAQEKPLYSNFEGKNAIGIFAFRARFHIQREVYREFVDRFALSNITCKYKFLRKDNGNINSSCP